MKIFKELFEIKQQDMKKLHALILIIGLAACGPTKHDDPILQSDSSNPNTQDSTLSAEPLIHEHHAEDEDFPWWDTPKVGRWIEAEHLNRLIEIHRNVSSTSILEYIRKARTSDSLPLFFELEGCAADDVFYLKSPARKHTYFAKSTIGILKSDTFRLKDHYTQKEYALTFPNASELYLDNMRFVSDVENGRLNRALRSSYKLYDNKGNILDSIHYNGTMVFNSDTIYAMSIVDYISSPYLESIVKPIITNADFISATLYSRELIGETTESKLATFVYEIKRTEEGFELHNRRKNHVSNDWDKEGEVLAGLHFRFENLKESSK